MTREEIFAVVKANILEIVEHVDEADIQESASMSDLYADSLEIVEVLSRSSKQLKLKVPFTELAEARNIGDVVDAFARRSTGRGEA